VPQMGACMQSYRTLSILTFSQILALQWQDVASFSLAGPGSGPSTVQLRKWRHTTPAATAASLTGTFLWLCARMLIDLPGQMSLSGLVKDQIPIQRSKTRKCRRHPQWPSRTGDVS
jgi:hypothetical protein